MPSVQRMSSDRTLWCRVLGLLIADSCCILSRGEGTGKESPLQNSPASLNGLSYVNRRISWDHGDEEWGEKKSLPCHEGGHWGDKKEGPWYFGGDWADKKGPPNKPEWCKGVPKATGAAPAASPPLPPAQLYIPPSQQTPPLPLAPPPAPLSPPTPASAPHLPATPPVLASPPPAPASPTPAGQAATHALAIANTADFNSKIDPEAYSTMTATWTPTAAQNLLQPECELLLLQSGQVMCAGGYIFTPYDTTPPGGYTAISTTQLYDPATGAWQTSGSLNQPRVDFNLVLLSNGRVLAAGGDAVVLNPGEPLSPALASAEVWDPATGMWSLTGSMLAARDAFELVALPDGTALACGGNVSSATVATCEIYNPASRTFMSTGSMTTGRVDFQMLLLPETGQVLAAGGFSSAVSGSAALKSAEIYNPGTKTWAATGRMGTDRAAFGMVNLGTAVLAAGGDSSGSATASSEVYNVSTQSWAATHYLNSARSNSGHDFSMVSLKTAAGAPLALAVGGAGGGAGQSSAEVFSLQTPGDYSSGIWQFTAPVDFPNGATDVVAF